MATDSLLFLCLSFRGSQRVATDVGAPLDKVSGNEIAFAALVAHFWSNENKSDLRNLASEALSEAGSTAIFLNQFSRMFSRVRVVTKAELPHEVIDLNVDGTKGKFSVAAPPRARMTCYTYPC